MHALYAKNYQKSMFYWKLNFVKRVGDNDIRAYTIIMPLVKSLHSNRGCIIVLNLEFCGGVMRFRVPSSNLEGLRMSRE